MKLLLVDDSKAMRMIIARTIKKAGFANLQTFQACNGIEALEVIEAERPSVVLSDWNMPEMNGIELLRALRAKGNSICFGFITSESSSEVRKEAESEGASFLITKPFTPQAFYAALNLILD